MTFISGNNNTVTTNSARYGEASKEQMLAFYAELEKNIQDESEARQSYYNLLLKFEYLMTPQERADIEEIISEELKHTKLLDDMIFNRNRIQPEGY